MIDSVLNPPLCGEFRRLTSNQKDFQPAFTCLKLPPYSSVYIVNFEHVIAGRASIFGKNINI